MFGNKNILITGGAGYLAFSLIKQLKGFGCRITSLDQKGVSPLLKEEFPGIRELRADISSRQSWEEALAGTDIVFHFAAQTSVYSANEDPVKDLNINLLPMVMMLEVCRNKGMKPAVLFSGTATQYGIPSRLPVDESFADQPLTIYDLHKTMAERYLEYYVSQGLVKGSTLRLANVYGPGPASSSLDRGVLNMMMHKALKGEDLTLYGEGSFKRDYIYVDDVARAFVSAAENIDKLSGRHFVLGTGRAHTLKEAFEMVSEEAAEKTGRRVEVKSIEPPASLSSIENRDFVADSGVFMKLTGWNPEYSLKKGIAATMDFFLECQRREGCAR